MLFIFGIRRLIYCLMTKSKAENATDERLRVSHLLDLQSKRGFNATVTEKAQQGPPDCRGQSGRAYR